MNQAKLTALDCRFDNSVNVYFVGEQPGDSAEPLCNVIEDEYIGWLEDYRFKYPNEMPSDEDCVHFMRRMIRRHLPEAEINTVAVLHRQP